MDCKEIIKDCIKEHKGKKRIDFNTMKNIIDVIKDKGETCENFFNSILLKSRGRKFLPPIIPAELFLKDQNSIILCEYHLNNEKDENHEKRHKAPDVCCIVTDSNGLIRLVINFSKFLVYEFEHVEFSKKEKDFMLPLHQESIVSNIRKHENSKFKLILPTGGRQAYFTHSIVRYCLDLETAKELLVYYQETEEKAKNEFSKSYIEISSHLPEEEEKLYKVSPTMKHAMYFDPQDPIEKKFVALSLSNRTFKLDEEVELFILGSANSKSLLNFLGVSKLIKEGRKEENIYKLVNLGLNIKTLSVWLSNYIEVKIPLKSFSFEEAVNNTMKEIKKESKHSRITSSEKSLSDILQKAEIAIKIKALLTVIKELYRKNQAFRLVMDFFIKKKKTKGIFMVVGIGKVLKMNSEKEPAKLSISYPSTLLLIYLNFK